MELANWLVILSLVFLVVTSIMFIVKMVEVTSDIDWVIADIDRLRGIHMRKEMREGGSRSESGSPSSS